jgi:hypothetical protein
MQNGRSGCQRQLQDIIDYENSKTPQRVRNPRHTDFLPLSRKLARAKTGKAEEAKKGRKE